jgi:hypothetical protein
VESIWIFHIQREYCKLWEEHLQILLRSRRMLRLLYSMILSWITAKRKCISHYSHPKHQLLGMLGWIVGLMAIGQLLFVLILMNSFNIWQLLLLLLDKLMLLLLMNIWCHLEQNLISLRAFKIIYRLLNRLLISWRSFINNKCLNNRKLCKTQRLIRRRRRI